MRILPRIGVGGRTAGLSIIALLACFSLSGRATAAVLPPGGSSVPDNFLAGLPGATLLATTGTIPFVSSTSTFSGTMVAAVYSDPGNTFGAGDLDFVYQVANNAGSKDEINRVTAIDFMGFSTDVGFTDFGASIPGGLFVNGAAQPPQQVDRSVAGDTIGFTQNSSSPITSILPGETSDALIIETNATLFAAGNVSLIDGGVATEPAFQPAIPEVSSTLLFGVGLVTLASARRALNKS
jgi:hypothetical protein